MQRRELQTVLIALGAIVLAAVAIAVATRSAPDTHALSASGAPSAATERGLWPLSAQPAPHTPALVEAGAAARNNAFSARVVSEFGDVALSEGSFHVMVEVEALEHGQTLERLPTDVIVALDSSGSMKGNKLANAKAAIRELYDALEPIDTISIVRFAHGAEAIVRRHPISDAKAPFEHALEDTQAGGGTCIGCGLMEAAKLMRADRPTRLILLSDGMPTTGETNKDRLAEQVAKMRRAHRFTAAALGVGRYADGAMLTAFAERGGGGRYYFLRNSVTIPRVIQAEVARMQPSLVERAEVVLELGRGARVDRDAAWFATLDHAAAQPTWSLGAMQPGERRRLVVPLVVAEGGELPVVTAHVTTDGARGPRAARHSARFASIRDTAPRDRAWEVSAEVARHRGEHTMGVALELLESGQTDSAKRELEAELARIEAIGRHGQREALAPTAANLERLLDNVSDFQAGSDTLLAERLNHIASQREVRLGVDDAARDNVFGGDCDCELE